MQLSKMTQHHRERLCIVLLNAHIDGLEAVHAQQDLGLLQSHSAGARGGVVSLRDKVTGPFR